MENEVTIPGEKRITGWFSEIDKTQFKVHLYKDDKPVNLYALIDLLIFHHVLLNE